MHRAAAAERSTAETSEQLHAEIAQLQSELARRATPLVLCM